MSMARCKVCDQHIDTDYNDEGKWDDGPPFEYTCGNCLEDEDTDE